MAAEIELSKKLTKILHRLPSDPSSKEVFLNLLQTSGIAITSVRVVVGDEDELDRLRRENLQHRATANQKWDEFEQLARMKGLKTMTAISEATGVDLEYLKSCKSHGRVSQILLQKLADIEDQTKGKKAKPGSTLGKKGERFDTIKRREQELRTRESNPRYLKLKHKYPTVKLIEGEAKVSDMTVEEMRGICDQLFGDASVHHQSIFLSGITGYSAMTHALQLKGKRNISESLARFLRRLRQDEVPNSQTRTELFEPA